jgi:hypothetical protein
VFYVPSHGVGKYTKTLGVASKFEIIHACECGSAMKSEIGRRYNLFVNTLYDPKKIDKIKSAVLTCSVPCGSQKLRGTECSELESALF